MRPFRALLLDLGEVLVGSQPPGLIQRMAELAGVPVPALTRAYWAHRNEYDLRGDARAYWDAVLRDVGSPLEAQARVAARPALEALDAESWTQYRDEVWEIAEGFRATGGRTALVSNCGPEVMNRVRAQREVGRFFDAMVVSSEVGVLKPDPAIYHLALQRLGVAAADALFVDDRPNNVAGAEAAGLHGFHFTGEESVAALRERIARGT
jgi:putative hydrolase of the HAD superfamily